MRILVTGASGLLGRYVLAACPRQHTVVGWSNRPGASVSGIPLTPVPLENPRTLEGAFRMTRPDVVLHLAAWAGVERCERDPLLARRVNCDAAAQLARLAQAEQVRFLFISTDLVFDGTRPPYAENDLPRPLSLYGQTKAAAEQAVLAAHGSVLRLPLLFGPGREGRSSFFDRMITSLQTGESLTLFHDEYRTPLDLGTAAEILWRLVETPTEGIYHAGGTERMSRVDMGLRLAAFLGLASPAIRAVSRLAHPGSGPRPADTSLHSGRLVTLMPELVRPDYEHALARLLGNPTGNGNAPSQIHLGK